jgi:tRNA pseudouridine55 synthase
VSTRGVMRGTNPIDGILLLDKPAGLSSNAALQRAKRAFGARKAGHTGSLDPLASGMLPICFGEATKVAGALLDGRKRYEFVIALGERTPSGDTESEVVEVRCVPSLETAHVQTVLESFAGTRMQTPPMYSALKHQGKPLYRLARRGIEVARAPRAITLEDIDLDSLSGSRLSLRVTCSKGTYIRALAEEIAAALGTVGHVATLRRLWAAPFESLPMRDLDELEAADAARRAGFLLPPDAALRDLPQVQLSAADASRLLNGQSVSLQACAPVERMRVYDRAGRFLGVASLSSAGELQPVRLAARLVTPGSDG